MRDELRAEMNDDFILYTENLYYFDGRQEHLIAENVRDAFTASEYRAAVVFSQYVPRPAERFMLSDVSSLYDAEFVMEYMYQSRSALYAVVGATVFPVPAENAGGFAFNDDASGLYFINQFDYETETGDLTVIHIDRNGNASAPVVIDRNVHYFRFGNETNEVYYIKNLCDEYMGDLYRNGTLIAAGIDPYYLYNFPGTTDFLYMRDFNWWDGIGTLYLNRGGAETRVATGVRDFTAEDDGTFTLIINYRPNQRVGDVYFQDINGEQHFIANNVGRLSWRDQNIDYSNLYDFEYNNTWTSWDIDPASALWGTWFHHSGETMEFGADGILYMPHEELEARYLVHGHRIFIFGGLIGSVDYYQYDGMLFIDGQRFTRTDPRARMRESALEIYLSQVLWVYIGNPYDTRVYSFIPTVSGHYVIRSFDNDGDPLATLYDADLEFLTSDDDSGGNLNFRMEYYLNAGHTYYIEARMFSDRTGSYSIIVEQDAYAAIRANARYLDLGLTEFVNISTPQQTQYFAFYPGQSGYYTFRSSNNTGDPMATLYDEWFNIITSDDDSGGGLNFLITEYLYSWEVYYLEVRNFSSGTGTFNVTVTFNP
jgi:hypothetical protein